MDTGTVTCPGTPGTTGSPCGDPGRALHLHVDFASEELRVGPGAARLVQLEEEGREEEGGEGRAGGVDSTEGQLGGHSHSVGTARRGHRCPPSPRAAPPCCVPRSRWAPGRARRRCGTGNARLGRGLGTGGCGGEAGPPRAGRSRRAPGPLSPFTLPPAMTHFMAMAMAMAPPPAPAPGGHVGASRPPPPGPAPSA